MFSLGTKRSLDLAAIVLFLALFEAEELGALLPASLFHQEPEENLCTSRAPAWNSVSERVSRSYMRDQTWPLFATAKQVSCGTPASGAALSRLLKKIANKNVFSIVSLGGSTAAGVDCVNEMVEGKECSWPGRLIDSLRLETFSLTEISPVSSQSEAGCFRRRKRPYIDGVIPSS